MKPLIEKAKFLLSPVMVYWDDTNLPFTVNGPRREGSFVASSFIRAWFWCQLWCLFHDRAATYIGAVPETQRRTKE